MAELDSTRAQAIDPEVQADLVRLLQIRGPLGVLNVADIIVPVVSLGNVVTPDINIRPPVFRSTTIFSEGLISAPLGTAILADTQSLPSGTYDVILQGTINDAAATNRGMNLQHRNAGNTANLMSISILMDLNGAFNSLINFTFSYELALNERLRLTSIIAGSAGSRYSAIIFARIR